MDISQHLQVKKQVTFHTDLDGKGHDYPCTVKKIKKNLVAVVLQSDLKDSPVCALKTVITLQWTTEDKNYTMLTKIVQNKTFPLVVLSQQSDIAEQGGEATVLPAAPAKSVAPAEPVAAPVAPPPSPPVKAPAAKPNDDSAISYYSHAEKKSLDPEVFEYIRDLINDVPQLYSLGPEEVVTLIPYVSYKSFKKGTLVFREGEPGDSLFYIVKGAVDIIKESVEGNPIKLAQFTQDSMLGEMALIDSAPRSATAKVADDAELIMLNRESFEGLLKDQPIVGVKVFKQIATTMSQRVRFANGRLADVLDLAHQEGIRLEDEDEE